MLPYLYVLSFSFLTFFIYDKIKKNNQIGYCFFVFISFLSLLLLSSFRAYTVGSDTQTYLYFWNNNNDFSLLLDKSTLFSEFGFELISYLTNYISSQFFGGSNIPFFMFISSLVLILTYSSIIKYSQYKVLSLFCFLTLGFYTFHFNGARQAIAIAIFLFSLRYILSANLKKYLLCIFFGFLFHKSILICLPFYYFFRQPLTVKMVSIIIFSSVLMAFSITALVDFAAEFDQRYSGYAENDYESGGLVNAVFYITMLLWLFFIKRINKVNNIYYDISLLSMLIVSCVAVVSITLNLNPSGILRLVSYFSQFLIIAIPISLYSFKVGVERLLVTIVAIIFMFLYFYFTTTNFSNLTPYQFNQDLSF